MASIQPIVAPAVDKIAQLSSLMGSGTGGIGSGGIGSGGIGSLGSGSADFTTVLSQAVGEVENGQQQTAAAMGQFLSGEDTEVHQVALVAQKAEMHFDLFMAVRNKVIAAYQEVMKMQL